MEELWGYATFYGGEPGDLDAGEVLDLMLATPARVYRTREGAARRVEAELAEAAEGYLDYRPGVGHAQMEVELALEARADLPDPEPDLVWEGDTCRVAGTEGDDYPPVGVVGRVRVED